MLRDLNWVLIVSLNIQEEQNFQGLNHRPSPFSSFSGVVQWLNCRTCFLVAFVVNRNGFFMIFAVFAYILLCIARIYGFFLRSAPFPWKSHWYGVARRLCSQTEKDKVRLFALLSQKVIFYRFLMEFLPLKSLCLALKQFAPSSFTWHFLSIAFVRQQMTRKFEEISSQDVGWKKYMEFPTPHSTHNIQFHYNSLFLYIFLFSQEKSCALYFFFLSVRHWGNKKSL